MTAGRVGVRIAGTGSQLPSRVLSNADLERLMDTNDEWIVQRTGIRERRIIDKQAGECTSTLSTAAVRKALAAARMEASELDLIVCATMTPEMPCPATACLVSERIGAGNAGAMDLNAACSGFVFGLNLCHDLIRAGSYRNIALIGADTLSRHMNYCTAGRATAIIFGDAAGAVILRATDDSSLGLIAQAMHADGRGWKDIYIPYEDRDFPPGVTPDPSLKTYVQMNGAAVFKFAVGTFSNLIAETLDKGGVTPEQVDMYVCHQSNARILQSARERFGIPPEKLYVNIDRVGNTVAASVPLCLDELMQQGRIRPGMKVMFVAFGGGLTWGSSLWQL
jgi:3-oxoacyl-[acyl-carrier-protein] synthase-3